MLVLMLCTIKFTLLHNKVIYWSIVQDDKLEWEMEERNKEGELKKVLENLSHCV